MLNDSFKLKSIRIFLWAIGTLLLFWWPLSHWFYPDLYHSLLGFGQGNYPDSFVKVIGTLGIIPVLMAFIVAINPIRNRDMAIILIVFCFLMAFTYIYLIFASQFPKLELINVGLSIFSGIFLGLFFPWKMARNSR